MKTVVILFVLFVGVAMAAVSSGIYSSPDHPGKCVINEKVFESGTHHNPSETECYRVECKESGFAEIATCGVQFVAKNCKNEGYKDVSKPYPECCDLKVTCE